MGNIHQRLGTFLILLVLAAACGTAAAQPSAFESYFEEGSFCSEGPLDTLVTSLSCGETFYKIAGRVAFPALVNTGPVTLSVLTLAPALNARYPLYVEVRGPTRPNVACIAALAGKVLLEAQGFPIQCGGVWETIGPLDLTQNGVPFGAIYHIQLVGFRELGTGYYSTGIARIRLTSNVSGATAVRDATWSTVRQLYR